MSSEQNIQIVRQMYAAFTRGDVAAILSQLAPDVRWQVVAGEHLPWGKPRHSPQEVGSFFMELSQHLDYQQFEPLEYIAQRDRVVVVGRDRCVVRANGRVIEGTWVMLWTLQNGLVTTFDYFDNSAQMVAALKGREV